MKVMQIYGNDYVGVPERIRLFNEKYPNGKIESTVTYEGNFVRCKSFATPDVAFPNRYFVGHAEEDRTQGKINSTNATENCETSAVGRVLGFLGIGVIDSIASADEVSHAIHKQEASVASLGAPGSVAVPKVAQGIKHCGVCNKEFTPPASFPKAINCSGACGNRYKAGERYATPEEFIDALTEKVGEVVRDVASG